MLAMAKSGYGAGFAKETGAIVMIERGKKLDRDSASQVRVFGQIDYAHTPLAYFFDNSIMRDRLADHRGYPSTARQQETSRERGQWKFGAVRGAASVAAFCSKACDNSRTDHFPFIVFIIIISHFSCGSIENDCIGD